MTLKFNGIEKVFEIYSGKTILIYIEHNELLYKTCSNILYNLNECISLYNGNLLENKNYIIPIFDLLNLNVNNKKGLTNLYKSISNNKKSIELCDLLSNYNSMAIEILDLISMEMNASMSFNLDFNLVDFLDSYQFRWNIQNDNFMNVFLSYINNQLYGTKFKIIITYNICDFISESDLLLLKKELEMMGLSMINISSYNNSCTYKFDERIIVDKDLCVI